jgi:hypothetical protein
VHSARCRGSSMLCKLPVALTLLPGPGQVGRHMAALTFCAKARHHSVASLPHRLCSSRCYISRHAGIRCSNPKNSHPVTNIHHLLIPPLSIYVGFRLGLAMEHILIRRKGSFTSVFHDLSMCISRMSHGQ